MKTEKSKVMDMVMVIHSALVRSHQSTYEGSFGPVPRGAPRANIAPNCLCLLMRGRASRSGGAHPTSPHGAMPTSPSRARTRGGSRCCIVKPLLAVGYGVEALQ